MIFRMKLERAARPGGGGMGEEEEKNLRLAQVTKPGNIDRRSRAPGRRSGSSVLRFVASTFRETAETSGAFAM